MTSKIPKPKSKIISRRRFLGSSAGLLVGSFGARDAGFGFPGSGRTGPLAPDPRPLTPGPWPPAPDPQPLTPSARWTPLNEALARFHNHADRFRSERNFRALTPAIERLRVALLAGGTGIEQWLDGDFRGSSITPESETVLRRASGFEVRRADWGSGGRGSGSGEQRPSLGAADFLADMRLLLSHGAPLTLAEMDCVAISEALVGSPGQRTKLRTRLRFELAGGPGVSAESGNATWQATGEWAIEWVSLEDLSPTPGLQPPSPGWKIASWAPVEMTTVRGPGKVVTDVTAAAFGRDASYASHLLRDTNYWRTVLDAASGIDIFGNYGVSVGDMDGDGRDEIYLCQPQGLPNRLYRQNAPGVFEDVAAAAGVDLLDATSMALFADVLNRGRQDLILITPSSPLLFLNEGHGRFEWKRNAFPAAGNQAALTGAALADYDGDGFLDLYVCAYAYFQGETGTPVPTPYFDAHNGPPNILYHNQGDGTFRDVTAASGLNHGNDRFSFACVWIDIDDDGHPDLAVVNDFGRNNLYHNLGNGRFEEVEDGLAGHGSGMSAAAADLDGDGVAEIYVGNMWTPSGQRVTADPEFQKRFADLPQPVVRQFAMGNALYHRDQGPGAGGQGQAMLAAMQQVPNAAGASRGRWAWCSDSFDLENDGHPDLYVANGYLSAPDPSAEGREPIDAYLWQEVVALSPHSNSASSEYRAAWSAMYQLAHQDHPWNGTERNVFFLNLGDGRFVDASAVSGLDFRDDGRAFAVFDFDGDGDADLVIHSRTGPQLRLLRNDVAGANHSLAIRLTGTTGNRDAVGAKVEVETASGRQTRFLNCGSGFLAQHSKELIFGLGPNRGAHVARVRWPGGKTAEYHHLDAGFRYYIAEGAPEPRREPLSGDAGLGSGASDANSAPSESAEDAAALTAASTPPRRAVAETPPAYFSTWLVEPLPMPTLEALNPTGKGRSLLWLWDAVEGKRSELQPLLNIQQSIRSYLVLWKGDSVPSEVAAALKNPLWRADDRFRQLFSTILANMFDRRREPVLPTGLLFETPNSLSSLAPGGRPVGESRTPNTETRLLKIYWAGAEAAELLEDFRAEPKIGLAALPFPGRALLCDFRRDLRALGAALAADGLWAEAATYLAAAVESSPADADALYNLALVRRELGQVQSALPQAEAALKLRPKFPEAENLYGVLLMQSNEWAQAVDHLEAATRLAPDFAEAWNNLGYLELTRGDLAAARPALEKALAIAPSFPDALDNLGIVLARRGETASASDLFHRVLELQPENEQAGNNLGVLYARQGKTQEAINTLRGVLDHNPEAASVLLNLARLELALSQKDEARRLLEGWLRRHPDDAAARQLLEKVLDGAPETARPR